MTTIPLNTFWNLIYGSIREYWAITEPHIEKAARQNGIPIELYHYSELGMNYFSIGDFQKRDPYTNPERFEQAFARLEFKDWIFPESGDRYQVSHKAQDAVRQIVAEGDKQLSKFALITDIELNQTAGLLKKVLQASLEAPEPPAKWAIITRFRTVDDNSPLIAQVREALMYLYAYRDDSHFSAAHPHFGGAGIVWSVLGYVWKKEAVTAEQMDERKASRGYDESDYEVAIQAAVEIGWLELAGAPNTYQPTQMGRELREQAERQTDEYFYRPWSVLSEWELEQLHVSLTKLYEQLVIYRNANTLILK